LRKQPAFWVLAGILLYFLAGFIVLLWFASVAGSVTGGGGHVNTEAFIWPASIIAAIATVMFFYGFYLHFTRK
jgi:hypothetical protein